MSSKRRIRRRSCTGKVRHLTAEDATRARAATQRSIAARPLGYAGPMNVYRCPFCRGYHVGHGRPTMRP